MDRLVDILIEEETIEGDRFRKFLVNILKFLKEIEIRILLCKAAKKFKL